MYGKIFSVCEALTITDKQKFMWVALREASLAGAVGDIPIGAVIVKDGIVIAKARNRVEAGGDPTLHAELQVIRKAVRKLGTKWLTDCDMYVTLEPCAMCAGGAVLARLRAVYAGAPSDKSGAAGTVKDVLTGEGLNHKLIYESGILAEECSALLSGFFKELRNKQ
jgi:tRNA(adenine34) deaminase